MKTTNYYWPLLAALGIGGCASLDNAMPTTADEAYRRMTVESQSDGTMKVSGPVSFYLQGHEVVAGFKAYVDPKGIEYDFAQAGSGQSVVLPVPRKVMANNRAKGFGFVFNGETFRFPPAYFEGLMRKVNEVANAKRSGTPVH